jgi:ClpP class serine protease
MTDPDVPLDRVLHTPGGLVLAALQIAKAVREHKVRSRSLYRTMPCQVVR